MPAKKTAKKKANIKKTKTVKAKKCFLGLEAEILIVIIGVIIIVALIAIFGISWLKSLAGPESTTGEVILDMYVMSQCPYGAQAEDGAIPAVQKFGGDVDYNIYYIVTPTETGFQSLHGQPEVDEDIRQLCIVEEYPDLFLDYLTCFNPNYQNAEVQYATCVVQLKIDSDKIASCVENQGSDLLTASGAKSVEIGARGSPTIYLDGEPYSGGRAEIDFARAICNKFNYEHDGCADIPKPVEVQVIVVTDDDCPSCDTSGIISTTKSLFPGAVVTTVDVDSAEGQALVKEHELVYLPSYIFDSNVVNTNSWITNTQLINSFKESGEGYRIRDEAIGVTWFIDETKQAEYFESIGIVKGDNKPQIDFFVMSYCPYGNQAEEGIAPVFDILGEKAYFNPRYVIYSNYGTGYPDYCLDEDSVLCSMHTVVELNQDIREACVAKYYGMQEWFDFALAMNSECTSSNADTCWKGVADSLNLDKVAIGACESDEGYELMAANKALGDKLGVRGSPTVFIDGIAYNGARTAAGYLGALCAAFEDAPAECDSVVAEPTTAAPAAGTC
ncbi:MAG: hypothetical protein ABIB43_02720 [archaeon]